MEIDETRVNCIIFTIYGKTKVLLFCFIVRIIQIQREEIDTYLKKLSDQIKLRKQTIN